MLKGYSSGLIKKELDQLFSKTHNDVPSMNTVEIYTARLKAAARGHAVNPNSTKTIDEKYLTLIENGVHEGKRFIEIRNELWEKYGEKSVGQSVAGLLVLKLSPKPQTQKIINHHPSHRIPI